jgi:hypothetical protein
VSSSQVEDELRVHLHLARHLERLHAVLLEAPERVAQLNQVLVQEPERMREKHEQKKIEEKKK